MYECVFEDSSGVCSLYRLGEEYMCVWGGGGGGARGVCFLLIICLMDVF